MIRRSKFEGTNRVAGTKRVLTSDWLSEWCDIFQPIKMSQEAKVQTNHNTQLKTQKRETSIKLRS